MCVVALVRSFFHDRRLKCLTNSTASRAAVPGTAAAITTIGQRRVIAHAQVRLSKCGQNPVQGSRRAVGVTYARSFPWFASRRTTLSGPPVVVHEKEAPLDRVMKQLIRLLNRLIPAQRPLRSCLQRQLNAQGLRAEQNPYQLDQSPSPMSLAHRVRRVTT